MESLETLKTAAIEAVQAAGSPVELEQLRVEYLGKKGQLTGLLKSLGKLSPEERPKAGALINDVKQELTAYSTRAKKRLKAVLWRKSSQPNGSTSRCRGALWIVVASTPLREPSSGLKTFFAGMGFDVVEGPEIEDDYHNFEALNIPAASPGKGDARYLLY